MTDIKKDNINDENTEKEEITNFIVKNINNIDVSPNEVITKTSVNRNYIKLLENDLALAKESDNIYENMFRIMPYVKGYVYKKFDLVFYIDTIKSSSSMYDPGKVDFDNIYLLQSLKENNDQEPKKVIVDHVPVFDDSGWKNLNPFGSIYYGSGRYTSLSSFVHEYLKKQLLDEHEKDKFYHKHGTLSSLAEVNRKVVDITVTNGNPKRKRIFFPTHVYRLNRDNTILNGFYRKWDNGLLEYDITYRLADTPDSLKHNNSNVYGNSIISANNISIYDEQYLSNDNFNENYKYFLSKDDMNIFNIKGNAHELVNNSNVMQTNLNMWLNSYSGTIMFPEKFRDLNYMVFNSSTISNKFGNIIDGNLNVNTITYVNKTVKSITALYIINTYNANEFSKVGLMNNKFHCQIIGRWK